MRLIFKSVSVRNFLSFGNQPTEIVLDQHQTTIVQAENGEGKTALFFDSFFFVLFGYPARDVKKGQICNFINRENCEVKASLQVNDDEVRLERGLSPDYFKVFVNDQEMWSSMKAKEKQHAFETYLNVSPSILSQMIFIGETQSFMSRTPAGRREFVERVLNLGLFSRMNDIAKSRVRVKSDELSKLQNRLSTAERSKKTAEDLLLTVREPDLEEIKRLEDVIAKNEPKLLKEGVPRLEALSTELKVASDEAWNFDIQTVSPIRFELDRLVKAPKDKCPTCGSKIEGTEHIQAEIDSATARLKEAEASLAELKAKAESIGERHSKLKAQVENAKTQLASFKASLEKERSIDTTLAEKLKQQIAADEEEITLCTAELAIVDEEHQKLSAIQKLLQKGTPKEQIIDQYLPFINQQVEYYLDMLELPVRITFDAQFNETFRARYRDQASYNNFSGGQKARIDFALLLTWRDVAKKLSSVETNLCVIDEFGSKLDNKGVAFFVDVLNKISGINFIGLTPKPMQFDATRIFRIELRQNFSHLM